MRYEYKIQTIKLSAWSADPAKRSAEHESELNLLGAQGWKMTAAVPYAQYVQLFFMRER